MQLLFLDESGTIPPINKISFKNFVIGGVIISENHWNDIHKNLKILKHKYKIPLESEIKWRYFSPTNQQEENGIRHLDQKQKHSLRDELYELITNYKSTKIISVVTNIQEAYKLPYINNQEDLYWYSYKQVVERFQYHLQDLSKEAGLNINGVVIIDNRLPCDDNKLRDLHSKTLLDSKYNYSTFNNLIEGLFIAPSHHSIGVQFADIITGAIFRKYEKNDDKCFSKIKKSIRNRNGVIEGYGIVKFPKKTTSS